MYESFLIGFVGAIAGSLLTGRSIKGSLEEKVSLTYDVVTKTHIEVAAVGLEQKHFEARLNSDFGEIRKLADYSLKRIDELDKEKNDLKDQLEETETEVDRVVSDINTINEAYIDEEAQFTQRITELSATITELDTELNQAKQSYVEMATKANEEISKLQGTVTTYHNALMEASRKNQELSVTMGMKTGS